MCLFVFTIMSLFIVLIAGKVSVGGETIFVWICMVYAFIVAINEIHNEIHIKTLANKIDHLFEITSK